MQEFIQEYGKILLVVVVVLALVAVVVLFRTQIGNIFANLFNTFMSKSLEGTGVSPTATIHP